MGATETQRHGEEDAFTRKAARMLAGQFIATVGMIVYAAVTLSAQWRVTTNRVPTTPDGKPNYGAPAPRMPDGTTPDLSGIWDVERRPCIEATSPFGCSADTLDGIPVGFIDITTGAADSPPMQPWAEALVKQHRENGWRDDPNLRCLPHAPPRMWANFVMQKVIHTSDSVTILDEYMSQYRQIFLDGRALPKDPEPIFTGYSVGKWEGDTLVIETIGIKGNWFDPEGHPLTEQARLIERIRRVDYGNLHIEVTVDDPKAYTRPWTRIIRLRLVLNADLLEYICNENEKDRQIIDTVR
jgi:hypothetical protein